MWRRMQLLVRSCNHASHFVGHGSAGLLFLGKKRRVVRYGKPLQYTLAAESFCSCHISFVWNGICAFHLVFNALLLRPDGGICSFVDSQFLDEFGEEATTLLPLQLGPVPNPGVINLLDILQDTVMTGVRVPPGPPTGGEPNSDSTS